MTGRLWQEDIMTAGLTGRRKKHSHLRPDPLLMSRVSVLIYFNLCLKWQKKQPNTGVNAGNSWSIQVN